MIKLGKIKNIISFLILSFISSYTYSQSAIQHLTKNVSPLKENLFLLLHFKGIMRMDPDVNTILSTVGDQDIDVKISIDANGRGKIVIVQFNDYSYINISKTIKAKLVFNIIRTIKANNEDGVYFFEQEGYPDNVIGLKTDKYLAGIIYDNVQWTFTKE